MSMNIIIHRTLRRGETTEGYMTIDGKRVCDTLENTLSCLPAGSYPITLVRCRQYSRKMAIVWKEESALGNPDGASPCLACHKLESVTQNTPMPVNCPQLKPGNGVHNRHDGSILVGTRGCLGCLLHPREVFGTLYGRIRKSIGRGNRVTLEIRDS